MRTFYFLIFCWIIVSPYSSVGQNMWTQKADFPGGNRSETIGFSIGGKGYMTLGIGNDLDNLWEYDTTLSSWTQKASFIGGSRSETVSFVIGDRAYIGAGLGYSDFWEYSQTGNIWTE